MGLAEDIQNDENNGGSDLPCPVEDAGNTVTHPTSQRELAVRVRD